MLPFLWDGCSRCWHTQENLGQLLSVPNMKQRLFPLSCVPVMISRGVARHTALLGKGREAQAGKWQHPGRGAQVMSLAGKRRARGLVLITGS